MIKSDKVTHKITKKNRESLARALDKYSLKELSEMGEEQAHKEVEEKLKRMGWENN
jgi:hypothetical protein|tara:strand:+ start:115 stop:282 length:168 start_codon:yes stop_codon:yes gene_type:complete